jgi:hypothetical protein
MNRLLLALIFCYCFMTNERVTGMVVDGMRLKTAIRTIDDFRMTFAKLYFGLKSMSLAPLSLWCSGYDFIVFAFDIQPIIVQSDQIEYVADYRDIVFNFFTQFVFILYNVLFDAYPLAAVRDILLGLFSQLHQLILFQYDAAVVLDQGSSNEVQLPFFCADAVCLIDSKNDETTQNIDVLEAIVQNL